MSTCIPADVAVALASAGDEPERVLEHVLGCPTCLDLIRIAAETRGVLSAGPEPRAGFAGDVMKAIGEQSTRPEPVAGGSRAASVAWGLVQGVLGAAVVFFVQAAAGSAAPVGGPPPVLLLGAVAAGVVLTTWSERPRSHR